MMASKVCCRCREYILKNLRKSIPNTVMRTSILKFKMKRKRSWIIVCSGKKGTRKDLKFRVPMIWKNQKSITTTATSV